MGRRMTGFHVKAAMGWGIMAAFDFPVDARFPADVQP
ncbi:hypothetical protein FHR96_002989 [Halomonas organivorans]|uniref:Uncharacterized protein n=1 Tax=Halomonas organivorans TaxID=257772 RepID=A0A7W5BZZ3_9GAMM|nr:hypothetical protein [Halomonas organivorans]